MPTLDKDIRRKQWQRYAAELQTAIDTGTAEKLGHSHRFPTHAADLIPEEYR
jgi:hypothetical protein